MARHPRPAEAEPKDGAEGRTARQAGRDGTNATVRRGRCSQAWSNQARCSPCANGLFEAEKKAGKTECVNGRGQARQDSSLVDVVPILSLRSPLIAVQVHL